MNFEFKTDPYIFKTIIKLMSDIDYYGYFTVTKNGLTGTCVNDNGSICMTFNINAELSIFKSRTTMVLASQEISRLLKRVSKTDKLTISDTNDEFVITSDRKKMTVESRVMKLNNQLVNIHFDDSYETGVTVESKNFFTGLIDIGDCQTVNIKQKGTGIIIEMCVDKVRQSVTKLGDTDGKTNFSSNYNLSRLLKLSPIQFVSPVFTLCFRKGYPLRITAPTNIGHIVFYIKPSV